MNFSLLNPDVQLWIALRTAARWEKKIAASLADCGVPVFLPLMQSTRKYGNQRRVSELPMFGGYVFCSERHFIGNPRVPSTCRKQVAQVLRPPDPDRLKDELGQIAAFLCDQRQVQERVYGKPGDSVEIVTGPFSGTEAIIVGLIPKKRRLVLEISFLNVRLEVEVEEQVVKKS